MFSKTTINFSPDVPESIREYMLDNIHDWVHQVEKTFHWTFHWMKSKEQLVSSVQNLTVDMSEKGKRAGSASVISAYGVPQNLRVSLNPQILSQPEQEWQNTITHEMAHIFMFHFGCSLNKKFQSHGAHWQRMHVALGGNAKRCHTMNLKSTKNYRTFEYSQNGKTITITSVRHNRVLKGAKYRSACGVLISKETFVKEIR